MPLSLARASLKSSRRTLGIGRKLLGNSPVRMICQLNVQYTDGTSDTIVSDNSWQLCADGPTVADSIYDGEHYDSPQRKSSAGICRAIFAGGFGKVDIMPAPAGKLKAEIMPGMKVARTITPVSVRNPKKDCYLFDAGEITAGWSTVTMSCPAGTRIVIKYGEKLNDDGTLRLFDVCGVDILDKHSAANRRLHLQRRQKGFVDAKVQLQGISVYRNCELPGEADREER